MPCARAYSLRSNASYFDHGRLRTQAEALRIHRRLVQSVPSPLRPQFLSPINYGSSQEAEGLPQALRRSTGGTSIHGQRFSTKQIGKFEAVSDMGDMNPVTASSRESWESSLPDELVFDPRRIGKEQLLKLSEISGLVSGLHIAGEWLLVALAIGFCRHFWNPILYLVTISFIGARQHALLIMMHDGAHYRLFRNHRVNDWISEVFLAWPNFVMMCSYRHNHFAHHRYLNTDRDPDWTRKREDPKWLFPKSWADLGQLLAGEFLGAGAIYNIRLSRSLSVQDTSLAASFTIGRLVFTALGLSVIVYYGFFEQLMLYWIVPFATWLMLVLRVRSIAEHFAIAHQAGRCSNTRTTLPSVFSRTFVAPKNVNFHLEHHLYPSVPFFRLPVLHKLLMGDAEFLSSVHLTRGYVGVIRECHASPE